MNFPEKEYFSLLEISSRWTKLFNEPISVPDLTHHAARGLFHLCVQRPELSLWHTVKIEPFGLEENGHAGISNDSALLSSLNISETLSRNPVLEIDDIDLPILDEEGKFTLSHGYFINPPAQFLNSSRPPRIMVRLPSRQITPEELFITLSERNEFERKFLGEAVLLNDADSSRIPEDSLRDSQRHKERCRAIASLLWDQEVKNQSPITTISCMVISDSITIYGCERKHYVESTIRAWIKDLCPDRSPGRRPRT